MMSHETIFPLLLLIGACCDISPWMNSVDIFDISERSRPPESQPLAVPSLRPWPAWPGTHTLGRPTDRFTAVREQL